MELSHLHPKFHHVISLSEQERINFLHEPRWIGYPDAAKILDIMNGLINRPVNSKKDNLLIVGDPNNGKTTIINRFVKIHAKKEIVDGQPSIPVISTEAPPTADIKGLCISILEKFNAPYNMNHPHMKLMHQITHLMELCQVKILIIDEIHSLLAGSILKQREAMNAIKKLCNTLNIPIIAVGTHDALTILMTDKQHKSRFDCIALKEWDLDKNYQLLLSDFEKIIPLANASDLHLVKSATLLHDITGGNIGHLHKLLINCATDAIISGEERISYKLIQEKEWFKPKEDGVRHISF